MARIGSNPVPFDDDVTVTVADDNTVSVEGPKGTLTESIDPDLTVKVSDGEVVVDRPTDPETSPIASWPEPLAHQEYGEGGDRWL